MDFDGHITKCGDEFVRMHLFEAAHTMLTRSQKAKCAEGLGAPPCEAQFDENSLRGGRAPDGSDHARDVARWDRVLFQPGGGRNSRSRSVVRNRTS